MSDGKCHVRVAETYEKGSCEEKICIHLFYRLHKAQNFYNHLISIIKIRGC